MTVSGPGDPPGDRERADARVPPLTIELHEAAVSSKVAWVPILLRYGAEVDGRMPDGRTPSTRPRSADGTPPARRSSMAARTRTSGTRTP